MIKFYKSEELQCEFRGTASSVLEPFSPIKEIIKKEDFSEYSFSINDEIISLKDCLVLLVNIKSSASVHIILKKDIDTNELIGKISDLKKIKIKDTESARNKTGALFEILKGYNPYFMIYNAKHEYQLYESEVFEILNQLGLHNFNLLYYNVREELLQIESEEPKEIKVNEYKEHKPVKEEKEIKDGSKIKQFFFKIGNWFTRFKPDLQFIAKNKFHFLFLLIASFLICFAFAVGLANAMIGKGISALFFICSLVGAFLNVMVYFDYFKNNKLLNKYTIFSGVTNLIGIALSLIGTVIFYNLDKSGIAKAIKFGSLAGISIGASVVIAAITVVIAYFIRQLKNKKSRV